MTATTVVYNVMKIFLGKTNKLRSKEASEPYNPPCLLQRVILPLQIVRELDKLLLE